MNIINTKDHLLSLLPTINSEDKEKMLNIERLRLETEQDLYVVAGQIYSITLHPIDSWTLFQWMQEHNVPSRYIIRRDSLFYKSLETTGKIKDVVPVDTDCLHNELLDLTDLLTRAKAFIVEWRTDSIVDAWLRHLAGCRYVFLQHGIIGTCLTEAYKKIFVEEYNDINCSSEYEVSLVAANCTEAKQKTFIAGLPRFDVLENLANYDPTTEKVLFVMLTWRNYLNRGKEYFFRSDYFKGIQSLLSLENVKRLKLENIRIVFASHHMLADNVGKIFQLNDDVEIVNTQEQISYWIRHAHAYITDFSSVAFDFLFLNKPVIFWIPDKDATDPFDEEKVKSALSLRKNFFNTIDSVSEVIQLSLHYAKNGFQLEEENKQKVQKYFHYKDHFCERIYNNINIRIVEEKKKIMQQQGPKGCPELSIVIPAYNVEKYISTCLESILMQTCDNFEVIIIDDGSTDYTRDICYNYAFQDTRIRVLTQQNAGVSIARNRGIEVARGRYITFVDADDWIAPEYVKAILNTQPESDLLFFGNTHHHYDGTLHSYSPGNRHATEKKDREELLLKMIKNDCWYEFFGYTWNKRFKSDIIRQHNICFQPGLALREDEVFTDSYARHVCSIDCIDLNIYHYRFSHNGLTYRFHPGSEVLLLAKSLQQAIVGITHKQLFAYKQSKIFHYLFTATTNLHTKESLPIFEELYVLYKSYYDIFSSRDNPFFDRRLRRRYKKIFKHTHWLSRLLFLWRRKQLKRKYSAV